jgi:hypothetical protein
MAQASAARCAAKERAQEGEGARVGQQRGELTTAPGLGMGGEVIFMPPFLFVRSTTNGIYRGAWK